MEPEMLAVVEKCLIEPAMRWHTQGDPTRPVRFTVKDQHLILQTYGSDTWKRSQFPLSGIGGDGEATCVAQRLLDQLKAAEKQDDLTVESDGNVLSTRIGRSQGTFPVMVEDGSHMWEPSDPPHGVADIDRDEFLWALSAAQQAAAPKSHKGDEVLRGVHLRCCPEGMVLSATNQYRLAQVRLECLVSPDADEYLVYPEPMIAAAKIMDGPLELLEGPDGRYVGLSDGTHTMLTAPLAQKFADITPVMKRANTAALTIRVEASALIDSLQAAGAGYLGHVEVSLVDGACKVSSRLGESSPEQMQVTLPADYSPALEGSMLTATAENFLGLARPIRSEEIELAVTGGKTSPLILREAHPEGADVDGDYFAVLSLVRR